MHVYNIHVSRHKYACMQIHVYICTQTHTHVLTCVNICRYIHAQPHTHPKVYKYTVHLHMHDATCSDTAVRSRKKRIKRKRSGPRTAAFLQHPLLLSLIPWCQGEWLRIHLAKQVLKGECGREASKLSKVKAGGINTLIEELYKGWPTESAPYRAPWVPPGVSPEYCCVWSPHTLKK